MCDANEKAAPGTDPSAARRTVCNANFTTPDPAQATTFLARPAETLISRLSNVRATGLGRWIARCPAHDDRSPSLSIREADDARILIHCFGGCGVPDIVAAVGLDLRDLFPRRPADERYSAAPRIPASDVLTCLANEVTIIEGAGWAIIRGDDIGADAWTRISTAVSRIHAAGAIAGGAYGR